MRSVMSGMRRWPAPDGKSSLSAIERERLPSLGGVLAYLRADDSGTESLPRYCSASLGPNFSISLHSHPTHFLLIHTR